MVTETKERMKEMWDEAVEAVLEKAKDMGIKGVNELKYTLAGRDKGYDTTEITQDILEKLLKGEIRTLTQLRKLKDKEREDRSKKDIINSQSSSKYTLLHYREEDTRIGDFVDVIDCIFI